MSRLTGLTTHRNYRLPYCTHSQSDRYHRKSRTCPPVRSTGVTPVYIPRLKNGRYIVIMVSVRLSIRAFVCNSPEITECYLMKLSQNYTTWCHFLPPILLFPLNDFWGFLMQNMSFVDQGGPSSNLHLFWKSCM